MLCNNFTLFFHELSGHRIDQIEDNRKYGEGTVDTESQPPNEILIGTMLEILKHQ